MISKVLPGDTGEKFVPKTLEIKEVIEESKARNFGRRFLSADDQSNGNSKSEENDPHRKPEGKGPILPNPDFEPMVKIVSGEKQMFANWVVKKEPSADGTFPIVFGNEGTYESMGNAVSAVSEEAREAILAEARIEAENIRGKASAEGYQKGYEQGMEKAREELRAEMIPVFEELRNSINDLVEYRGEVLRLAEQEIFELAVLISKKVIHGELHMRPEAVLDVVRHALDRAVGWGKAIVQVNPEDYAFMEEHRLLLNEEAEGVILARVESNPSITRGGCVLESNYGEIDARLEKQMEAVEIALRETLASRFDQQRPEQPVDESHAAPEIAPGMVSETAFGPENDPSDVQSRLPEEQNPPMEHEGQ